MPTVKKSVASQCAPAPAATETSVTVIQFTPRVAATCARVRPMRSQSTVTDTEYMRAMIPHHSIAIMTSERAHIRDPRVRELAKNFIVAQRREIAEMKYLIADIDRNGVRTGPRRVTGERP